MNAGPHRSDEDLRLLASLVSGNLLVVRRPGEVASAAEVDEDRVADRLAELAEEGLVVEVDDDRYAITDEGFEAVVEEMDFDKPAK